MYRGRREFLDLKGWQTELLLLKRTARGFRSFFFFNLARRKIIIPSVVVSVVVIAFHVFFFHSFFFGVCVFRDVKTSFWSLYYGWLEMSVLFGSRKREIVPLLIVTYVRMCVCVYCICRSFWIPLHPLLGCPLRSALALPWSPYLQPPFNVSFSFFFRVQHCRCT